MQLNSSKPFFGLFAMFIVGYIVYTLIASDPLTRMNRMCAPVTLWPGKIVVSGTRVLAPTHVDAVQGAFDHGFRTCRRFVWGVLYRQEYEKLKAEQDARKAQKAAQQAGAPPADPPGASSPSAGAAS